MPSTRHAESQQLHRHYYRTVYTVVSEEERLHNGGRKLQTYHIHWLILQPAGRTAEQFSDDPSWTETNDMRSRV